MHYPEEAIEKFWSIPNIIGLDDCWIWTRFLDDWGYGSIWFKSDGRRRRVPAHRFAYAVSKGHVPGPKTFILHTCDNPACVNPAHLRLGTPQDNSTDMCRKGRQPFASLETCIRGHPWTPENTYFWEKGAKRGRYCRECTALRQRNAYRRRVAKRQAA